MSTCAFYINADECMNCKTCMAACNDVHNLSPELHLRTVIQTEKGDWSYDGDIPLSSNVFAYSLSISCNHCDNPICVVSCPRSAIAKDLQSGVVFIDQDLCIGCGKCAKQCPYHAPIVNRNTKKAIKCDTCYAMRNEGEIPACVAACSMRCLSFYTGDTLEDVMTTIRDTDEAGGRIITPGKNGILPDPNITNPNLVITPHRRDI